MKTIPEGRVLSSIGGSLRETRTAAGCRLEQVAEGLGIRVAYLEALEEGGLDQILGPAYVESFIVRYAMYLGLDPEEFLASVAQSAVEPANGASSNAARPNGARPQRAPANGASSNGARPNGTRPNDTSAYGVPSNGAPSNGTSTIGAPSNDTSAYGARSTPSAATSVHQVSAGRRTTRRAARSAAPASRRRSSTVRIAVLAVLVLTLVAVGILGGLELDIFSLFGGGDSAVVEQSGTLAAAATPVAGAVGGASSSAATTPVDATPAAATPADATPADATPAMIATTTTTLRAARAAGSTEGAPNVADNGGAPAAGAFTLEIAASDEAWVEVRDAESGEALHVGAVAKGASISLDVDGPVNVVAGRPEVLSVKVDGQAVTTPNTFRWVVTVSGVQSRS